MQIVKYEVLRGILTVGFRVDNFVVFSTIPHDDSKTKGELLQEAYKRVKKTIDYERTQTEHSFVTYEEGEVFIPDAPIVSKIVIEGDRVVQFSDAETESKTVELTAIAFDQYGAPISTAFDWQGADGGVLTVNNADDTYDVAVSGGGVSESVTVRVYGYKEPIYIKSIEDEIADYVAYSVGLDFKVTMLELGLS